MINFNEKIIDNPFICLKNVHKNFGNVKALKGVNLRVFQNKVMGVLGENGAGKSTLMNILSGVFKMSSGSIVDENNCVLEFNNIFEAEKFGISIIHQEILAFPEMTIIDNIFIGHEKSVLGFIKYKTQKELLKSVFEELNLKFSPKTLMNKLTIAEQQLVEIAKAMIKKSKVIIMDEPTSSLSQKETKILFKIIDKLKMQGCAILYISHRMEEIPIVCDYITVIRDGTYIGEFLVDELSEEQLINKIVGRNIEEKFPLKQFNNKGDEILRVKNLSNDFLKDINFELYKGEILGFAGLVGARRTELFKTLIGLYNISNGKFKFQNIQKFFHSPNSSIKKGFYYVTEDRKIEGLHLNESIKKNISVSSMNKISKFGFLNFKKENEYANNFINYISIKTPNSNQKVSAMSGGNQQKILLAKAFCSSPKVLVFDEPTRGVDVGSRREIYDLIFDARSRGVGIIVISSDLAEIVGLCDRVIVMKNGRITKVIEKEISQENVIKYAL